MINAKRWIATPRTLFLFSILLGLAGWSGPALADCNCRCLVSLAPAYSGNSTPPQEVYSFEEQPKVSFQNCLFSVRKKDEECRRTCAATAAVDGERYDNDDWWCRTLDRPFDGEVTLYSQIGTRRWQVAGKRRVQCKRCCDCPEGIYDPSRESCIDRVACDTPGLPDGDKGGGYSALGGQLFLDVPGAQGCRVEPGTGPCAPPCGSSPCDCQLSVQSSVEVMEGCDRLGAHRAVIRLNVSGGTAPYTVRSAGGQALPGLPTTGSSPFTFGGATFATYAFEVTDADGTVTSLQVKVEDPIQLNLTSTPASCATCADGSVAVAVDGGTPPYTYRWDDSRQQVTSRATGLEPGTYEVTVTDDEGCRRTGEVTVSIAGPPTERR